MLRTTKRSSVLAIAVVLAAAAMIALTAGPAAAKSKVQVLHLSVKPGMLMFNTKTLKAHTGTIEIVLDNPKNSGNSHGIAVTGHGVTKESKVVSPGNDTSVTVKLTQKGKYTFYCQVPGHEAAGMKGTLTVS